MHRLDRLDEGIFEEAERGIGAPHQALHDPGHPHRGDVEHDAERRDPEVPVDELEAVKLLLVPQPRDEAVQRAERHEADPAERAGMHVTDGPFGVWDSEFTTLIDIIGPSKVDMP